MQPHPRIRKTIKWDGLVLTVLLVGAWIGSGWWNVAWFDWEARGFVVSRGILSATFDLPHDNRVRLTPGEGPPRVGHRNSTPLNFNGRSPPPPFAYGRGAGFPLGVPVVLRGGGGPPIGAFEVREPRRARLNLC